MGVFVDAFLWLFRRGVVVVQRFWGFRGFLIAVLGLGKLRSFQVKEYLGGSRWSVIRGW